MELRWRVHSHDAGLELISDTPDAAGIARVKVTGESVRCIVREYIDTEGLFMDRYGRRNQPIVVPQYVRA